MFKKAFQLGHVSSVLVFVYDAEQITILYLIFKLRRIIYFTDFSFKIGLSEMSQTFYVKVSI